MFQNFVIKMKKIFFGLFLLQLTNGAFALSSPIKSTVDGFNLPNLHQVDREGLVYRSMSPDKEMSVLQKLGIKNVLIFKNQTRREVDKEILELSKLKITHLHIPFLWKDIEDYSQACQQIVSGIQFIKRSIKQKKKVLFHCTVGEDRTGILSGLFTMLNESKSIEDVFRQEMCEKGYGKGNPFKPYKVTSAIRSDLTPLFLAMAKRIAESKVTLSDINESLCHELKVESEHDFDCESSSLID
ncbi:MAG: hypothetical protein COW00_01035 [Bdellovibrio sp. CG12_big_fil_rev_8_21_14_0_65_39_13]|nr:MAG: hypothetical protein COW78_10330 [Bdellovibrio sp. CG22_combo_CG10-13_8_21_14_all_39_27]PIQ62737.1 MAG: hypothetical protein COW00_01035 [Bdellovibrio sp. CG12_big_fil_rev_8_21_14_0_65_39_13]PIR36059.1 MAG: hypothetical protein COV37_05255 [Bdellovibrio sp. CG11_big_fil_rev_8_21_14_0_20_39_38]PJB52315.1 MAG: hypothetical protein CO099_13325 [Bdellovibrio sp. CG_4_9_14_3_um_filter_39_7]